MAATPTHGAGSVHTSGRRRRKTRLMQAWPSWRNIVGRRYLQNPTRKFPAAVSDLSRELADVDSSRRRQVQIGRPRDRRQQRLHLPARRIDQDDVKAHVFIEAEQ